MVLHKHVWTHLQAKIGRTKVAFLLAEISITLHSNSAYRLHQGTSTELIVHPQRSDRFGNIQRDCSQEGQESIIIVSIENHIDNDGYQTKRL